MDVEFKQTIKIFGVLFGVLAFGVLVGVSLVNIGYVPISPDQGVGVAQEEERGQQEKIKVGLTVDYGNNDTQTFPEQILRNGETALDLLEESGVVLEKRSFPGLGVFIEAIHGVHNTNKSYWQFWVNGEYAQVGASQYVLKDGDKVLWKRTNERPE